MIIVYLALLIMIGSSPCMASAEFEPDSYQDGGQLLSYIRMADRQNPLVAFGRTQEIIDAVLSQENRRYIGQNKALLEGIEAELGSNRLHWQLKRASKRLMIVPETRQDYASLFEKYCRSVVDHVLKETRLPNPYQNIATLDKPLPVSVSSGHGGITAYLVHNIAHVYTEEYDFFDPIQTDRKVRIKLDNRTYPGEVGSYSSYLVIQDDRSYEFERNSYTLWRNSAENPINVLIVPVEETLHIALRHSTEKAIRAQLLANPPDSRADIDSAIEEWLAVEEAVVGGMVGKLWPGIQARFPEVTPKEDIAPLFIDRNAFAKYRFLGQGMAIVNRLGLQPAIRIYQEQPARLKSMLLKSSQKAPTAAGAKDMKETRPKLPAA